MSNTVGILWHHQSSGEDFWAHSVMFDLQILPRRKTLVTRNNAVYTNASATASGNRCASALCGRSDTAGEEEYLAEVVALARDCRIGANLMVIICLRRGSRQAWASHQANRSQMWR